VESDESRNELNQIGVASLIEQIDNEKQEAMFRSLNQSLQSSPKRDKFFHSRRFSGLIKDEDIDVMRSISNAEEVYIENEQQEQENFES